MTDPIELYDEVIFAYLDGELGEQQATEFELLRSSNSDVQYRLDTLVAINGGLARIAEPVTVRQTASGPTRSFKRWYGYAALLIITTGLFLYMNPPAPKQIFNAQLVYTKISVRFEPQIVCDTPEKFRDYTNTAFGKPISVDFDSTMQLVGWRYLGTHYNTANPPKEKITRILMAQTPDGTKVLAAFVPRGLPAPKLTPGSDLHIFKRTVQSVRVYEITPLDSPSVLDLLE